MGNAGLPLTSLTHILIPLLGYHNNSLHAGTGHDNWELVAGANGVVEGVALVATHCSMGQGALVEPELVSVESDVRCPGDVVLDYRDQQGMVAAVMLLSSQDVGLLGELRG